MTHLSGQERNELLLHRKLRVDPDVVAAAPPRVILVAETGIPRDERVGPLWPLKKFSPGWRLWKRSGMELQDYLQLFDRSALCGETWDQGQAEYQIETVMHLAETYGMPVVFLGARAAGLAGHCLPAHQWWNDYAPGQRWAVPTCRLTPPGARSVEGVADCLRLALQFHQYPPFHKSLDIVESCGRRLSAHPAHPQVPFLRVTCPSDKLTQHRVVLPWGRSLHD